jgi:hypothetical protein
MKRTRTLVLASLAILAAAGVSACKKAADNTADNTPAADSNTPPASDNSMGATNAPDTNSMGNTATNAPS